MLCSVITDLIVVEVELGECLCGMSDRCPRWVKREVLLLGCFLEHQLDVLLLDRRFDWSRG